MRRARGEDARCCAQEKEPGWRPAHYPHLYLGVFWLPASTFTPFLEPRHTAAAHRMILAPEARQNHSPPVERGGRKAQPGGHRLGKRREATPRAIRSRSTRATFHRAEPRPAFIEANAFRRIACDAPRGRTWEARHRLGPRGAVEATASRGAPAEDLRQPLALLRSRRWREETDLRVGAPGSCAKGVGNVQGWSQRSQG